MGLWCVLDKATHALNAAAAAGSSVFLALLFARSLLGTPLVMWLYRRRVVKLMTTGDDAPIGAVPGPQASPAAPVAAGALVAAAVERTRGLRNALVAACALYSVLVGLLVTLSPEAAASAGRGAPGPVLHG